MINNSLASFCETAFMSFELNAGNMYEYKQEGELEWKRWNPNERIQ